LALSLHWLQAIIRIVDISKRIGMIAFAALIQRTLFWQAERK
jgi:hypothetical protein